VLGKTRRVHFVGVGGIGMSGIAELLVNLGYAVSGSDAKASPVTDRLERLGVRVSIGHAASQVEDADVAVVSSAIPRDNPEVHAAERRSIPVIPRAEMLAELMRLRQSVAVAGAHGKTTTTSMIALMLERAGLDPTAVIGGRLKAFGSNARLGRGDLMVAEADESDRSFLRLFPIIAVITNIDREHLESYGSFEGLQQAFVEFANHVPFYGAVIACADDPHLTSALPRIRRRVITYGIRNADADLVATDITEGPMAVSGRVLSRVRAGSTATERGWIRLSVPGRHNLQNALAAVAVGLELDLPFDRISEGLAEFSGAERRFEVRGEPRGILVVDDYGHHPTEIAAVLAAARPLNRRIVVVFQPHRFSRTLALLSDFGPALAGAQHLILTDIYGAGEAPIEGATLDRLADAIRRTSDVALEVVPRLEHVPAAVARVARPGDVVITLGAGSIGTMPERVVAALEAVA